MVPTEHSPTDTVIDVSVIVPIKDEAESIRALADEITQAMDAVPFSWECLWVDDGSTDGSLDILMDIHETRPERHHYLSLDKNYGQSAALYAGFRAASGRIFATLDGDLQNDPREIPRLLTLLERGKADMVNGIRLNRRDGSVRRICSRIANGFRNSITKEQIVDVGCSLRVFYRDCVEEIPVFTGMHRFLPTLARMSGFQIIEVVVDHRPRSFGQTKYGINNRLWAGLLDCFAVRWMQARVIHPRIKIASFQIGKGKRGSQKWI
jgi:glycosyltransferase involved in cell wall biosynthesis